MDNSPEVVYYVSINGNDSWSGKLPEPNANKTDGPFATLNKARNVIRELKELSVDNTAVPITVMVRGGKYFLQGTFCLTEQDSGTSEAPITYKAYPGEVPLISGGRRVTEWIHYKDSIYRTKIPEVINKDLYFRELFADGQPQIRSRYPKLEPNADFWRGGRWAVGGINEAVSKSTSEPHIIWDEPDAFKHNWSKPNQGEIFVKGRGWGDSCLIRILSVEPQKGVIWLTHGLRDFCISPMFFLGSSLDNNKIRGKFIIENLLEELTSPGEWCLDTEDGYLYFWPINNNINEIEVTIPILKRLIHMEGVSNVNITGFSFVESNSGAPCSHYKDVEGTGAMKSSIDWEYCGEAIYMNKCKSCTLEKNKIFNIGGNGIYLRHHNEMNVIRRNEISNIGANGIVLAGAYYSIYTKIGGTKGTPHPIYNEITDNEIHHIGYLDNYCAGVFLGLCNWNRVVHNYIHDVPHHGINLGNNRYGRNYIEYNRIVRAAQVTNDTAAINCWHEVPPEIEPAGHVIRYNYILDTGSGDKNVKMEHALPFGIYLDNWSSNCLIYGNIIVNTKPNNGRAIFIRGHNNIIQNNIIINSGKSHIFISAYCSYYPEFSTIVMNNIFYDTFEDDNTFFEIPYHDKLCKVLLYCDKNIFYKHSDKNPLITKFWVNEVQETSECVRFSDWSMKYGRNEKVFDVESVIADPEFVDVENGNFQLREDSKALKLGFNQIDFNQIGIRKET